MVIASRTFYGHEAAMSDNERVHFKIALPVGLKKQLEHEAVDNRRSLSAEIIARLEASLAGSPTDQAVDRLIDIISVRLLDGRGTVRKKTKEERDAEESVWADDKPKDPE